MSKTVAKVKINETDRIYSVVGQEARALAALFYAGGNGITADEVSKWARRLSQYVMKLRRLGIIIETVREKHTSPDAGWHGRYVLHSVVQFIDSNVGTRDAVET